MFFGKRNKNLCKICNEYYENYDPFKDIDCRVCFKCYQDEVTKATPDIIKEPMCKICEEEDKEKLEQKIYFYRKILAKMAYEEIQQVIKKYESKGIDTGFWWQGCIRIDDELFDESDLYEDEGE